MNTIKVKKGHQLIIEGRPSLSLEPLSKPDRVAVLPEHVPYVKPRLLVDEGTRVKIGSPLFEDKRNTDIKFLSPGAGTVETIRFGPRRVIREIVVRLDENETFETFSIPEGNASGQLERHEIVDSMIKGGLWPFLRTLPFRDIADPEITPPSILVCLGDKEPFKPDPGVYIKGNEGLIQKGIELLSLLSERVMVAAHQDYAKVSSLPEGMISHSFSGPYPADHPAVMLYHVKAGTDQNRSWFIDGQDLLQVARFFDTGTYPVERIVSLSGSCAENRKHYLTRAGVPLSLLTGNQWKGETGARHVVGGLFTGFTGSRDSYMGFYESALALIPEGDEEAFLGFARPGFKHPSYSRAFLSVFNKGRLSVDCGQHGEVRACVNCGTCASVCPVDILPQFMMKTILVDEVEEALSHGLLDCAQCGLCTYVCPSKIELCASFVDASRQYYKEMG